MGDSQSHGIFATSLNQNQLTNMNASFLLSNALFHSFMRAALSTHACLKSHTGCPGSNFQFERGFTLKLCMLDPNLVKPKLV